MLGMSIQPLPLQGLAEHKDELGAPLCPCRHYDDKQLEAEQGFWNCPCVPMRERKVSILMCALAAVLIAISADRPQMVRMLCLQECHCMLFLTEDNSFRGDDTKISLEEVVEATKGMSGVQP